MSDFLAQMAEASRARVASARSSVPEPVLRAQVAELPPPPPLILSAEGFDLIAELKLRSPAEGLLADARILEPQARAYAGAGACAVSVLTEPERFAGSLAHLDAAARWLAPAALPVLRKDFLVDPYQVLEARLAGAGGVLLIARLLADDGLEELLEVASEYGLFVLLECFDEADLARATRAARRWRGAHASLLVGVNCRDLVTLNVHPERLLALAGKLPGDCPHVAESGVATPADAARLARAGYGLALVGSALMGSAQPATLGRELLAAGRAAVRERRGPP